MDFSFGAYVYVLFLQSQSQMLAINAYVHISMHIKDAINSISLLPSFMEYLKYY